MLYSNGRCAFHSATVEMNRGVIVASLDSEILSKVDIVHMDLILGPGFCQLVSFVQQLFQQLA